MKSHFINVDGDLKNFVCLEREEGEEGEEEGDACSECDYPMVRSVLLE